MSITCPLCESPKEANKRFCEVHEKASTNLESGYVLWQRAYNGQINKDEYHARLMSLNETGGSVKDVIEHIRKGEGER